MIEAKKFSVTHKIFLFRYGWQTQTQASAFVTIFLRQWKKRDWRFFVKTSSNHGRQTTWNSSVKVFWNHRFLQISAKIRERQSFSSLASYSTMSSFRPLLSAHDFQTFIHVLVVLTVFLFTAFSASFCISFPEICGNLAANFFDNKSENVIVFRVVMATLLYRPFFAVIPLLPGNSDIVVIHKWKCLFHRPIYNYGHQWFNDLPCLVFICRNTF